MGAGKNNKIDKSYNIDYLRFMSSNDEDWQKTNKNLFCTVGSICNLVQEFNGLVSNKGQRKLALLHL
jgi:hypothetical protein